MGWLQNYGNFILRNFADGVKDGLKSVVTGRLLFDVRRERKERERQARLDNDRRTRNYRSVTDRPDGEQEAGNTFVDGHPAYYEDGGSTSKRGRRERYSGPNGPFGSGHHHDTSHDDGETWERWH